MEQNIAEFLTQHRNEIIEDWNRRIILDLRPVVELLGVDECREITAAVLDRLIETLDADPSEPPAEGVAEVSRKLSARRVTPFEAARLIFSLKERLFPVIGEAFADPDTIDRMMEVDRRIDDMGVAVLKTYLEAKEAVIADQQKAFQEVSVPVVKVWDRIIMIPLVGMLDSERTQLMMEVLLSSLEDLQARVAILDISGIPVVDTLVARHLITAASAVRLMGAECIITGIRARIAQTLVELGVDLGGFMTRTTLADGLAAALDLTGQVIG